MGKAAAMLGAGKTTSETSAPGKQRRINYFLWLQTTLIGRRPIIILTKETGRRSNRHDALQLNKFIMCTRVVYMFIAKAHEAISLTSLRKVLLRNMSCDA